MLTGFLHTEGTLIGKSGSAGQAESATGSTTPRSREVALEDAGVLAVDFVFLVAGTLAGTAVSAGAAESPSLRKVLLNDDEAEEGVDGGRTTVGVIGAGGEVGVRPLERDLVRSTGSAAAGTGATGVRPCDRERSRRGGVIGREILSISGMFIAPSFSKPGLPTSELPPGIPPMTVVAS